MSSQASQQPEFKHLPELFNAMIALVGKGLAEGAYENTVTGNAYAEGILEGAEALKERVAAAPELLEALKHLIEAEFVMGSILTAPVVLALRDCAIAMSKAGAAMQKEMAAWIENQAAIARAEGR